jgi:hypothetical protein
MAAANDTLELVNFFESTNTSYEVNSGKSSQGMGPDDGQSPSADRGENVPVDPNANEAAENGDK